MPASQADLTSAAAKVAPVTLAFWVMKVCATTLGETAGDLLSMTLDIGYAWSSVLLLSLFALALTLQLRSTTFRPGLYWTVILATSTAGTTLSDFIDRTLGIGYATGATLLVLLLAAVLAAWRGVEGSLSVTAITRRRTECFYWAAVLVSNTLGTALGDYLADDSGLGFLGGALLIGSLIAATAAVSRVPRANRVLLFWIAFVLTRPFGATFGDLLTKPASAGGLDVGTWGASAVLASIFMLCMLAASLRQPKALA